MATNPYTEQTISGYNANPPGDDGTEVDSNKVEWAKHIDKIGDPIKTLAEAINDAVNTAFGKVINTDADENNQIKGSLAFLDSELTISTGSITATRTWHTVDTEGDAASDDLDTIGTGSVDDGAILIIRANNTARTVVVKHEAGGAGQIHLADDADFSLDDDEKRLVLQRDGADWYEISRSSNERLPRPGFTSSEQTVSTDTKLDVAHGLSSTPILVQVIMRCKTADLNYSVGDEVLVGNGFPLATASGNHLTVSVDSTNVSIIQPDSIEILNKTGFDLAAITTGNWRWVIRAWA